MEIIQNPMDKRLAECLAIRAAVFITEQHVPTERERDGFDDTAIHYLFYRDGKTVGTARSRFTPQETKIERFALLPEVRGLGLGHQAFESVIGHCRDQAPGKPIVISAQAYLQSFYERLGFKAEGAVFRDAGIPHVRMVLVN